MEPLKRMSKQRLGRRQSTQLHSHRASMQPYAGEIQVRYWLLLLSATGNPNLCFKEHIPNNKFIALARYV